MFVNSAVQVTNTWPAGSQPMRRSFPARQGIPLGAIARALGVSFSCLRNLGFQALRIDNSFIHNIDTHQDNRFYLESVVAIAHSRGVKVFATGVETAAEYSVLCKLGIDGAMGYHLGRPFAADNQQTGD